MGINNIIIGISLSAFLLTRLILDLKKSKKFENEGYQVFGKTEKEIAIILIAFMKYKKFNDSKSLKILNEIFENYYEKLLISIPKNFSNYIIKEYAKKMMSTDNSCNYLSKKQTKIRLFVLYNLLDIAAYDKIYSAEEEVFINTIRQKIKIPIQTFNIIKASYTKRGMKDERLIIEEQKRKKLVKSILPYNAYKILGVSPDITKTQLKKVYRTLAKKYHPDKFHGQSEEVIQKAEDKFQEITEAFNFIMKHKNY